MANIGRDAVVLIAFNSKSPYIGLGLRAQEMDIVIVGLSPKYSLLSSLVWERKRGFEQVGIQS